MTEFVAVVADENGDRRAFHELDDDGAITCPAGRDDTLTFTVVAVDLVPDSLHRCKHCSGDVDHSPGQGSALASKLAAADPDEVSAP